MDRDNTTDLRAAAQAVIEAYDRNDLLVDGMMSDAECTATTRKVESLRAALAQPQPVAPSDVKALLKYVAHDGIDLDRPMIECDRERLRETFAELVAQPQPVGDIGALLKAGDEMALRLSEINSDLGGIVTTGGESDCGECGVLHSDGGPIRGENGHAEGCTIGDNIDAREAWTVARKTVAAQPVAAPDALVEAPAAVAPWQQGMAAVMDFIRHAIQCERGCIYLFRPRVGDDCEPGQRLAAAVPSIAKEPAR